MTFSVPDPNGRWLARERAWELFARELAQHLNVDIEEDHEGETPIAVEEIFELADELVGVLGDVGLKLAWEDEGALILAREGRG